MAAFPLAPILGLLLCAVLIIWAFIMLKKSSYLRKFGIEVPGRISALKKTGDPDDHGEEPIVSFKTRDEIIINESSNLIIFPGYFKMKKAITIIYDEKKPKSFIIKDKITYIVPICMICVGVLIAFVVILTMCKIIPEFF